MKNGSAKVIGTRAALERMTKIYALLSLGHNHTATTFAKEFETSTKTIHRDLEFLRERIRLPIFYDAKANTWKTDPAARLPWWITANNKL